MIYYINDLDKGLHADDLQVFAKSPKSALIKAGYIAERDYTGKGEILVYSFYDGKYKSYVYRKIY